MPTGTRARAPWVALVGLLVALGLAPGAGAAGDETRDHLARINALRTSRGLVPLVLDANLSDLARSWAEQLAAEQTLRHAGDLSVGVSSSWTKLGENLGRGPSTEAVFAAFVSSPAHYANLVDPAFTHVGIGVVWVGATQYTVHRFMAASSEATPPAVTARPTVTAAAGTTTAAPDPPAPEPSVPNGDEGTGAGGVVPDRAGAPSPNPPAPAEPARMMAVLDALHALAR